jgi:DNA-binding NarL/FixJ family response regulator
MEPIFKILIVEDHVLLREGFRDILSNKFPKVAIEEAGNGDQATEKLTTFKPHLIFMDIGLPGKHGIELTKEIKSNHPDSKVVILTGLGPYYNKAAYECGADWYFEKGLSPLDEIFAKIEESMTSFPLTTL